MNDNSLTNYLKAQKNLKIIAQTHLLDLFPSLLKEGQDTLVQSILSLDLAKFKLQKTLFDCEASPVKEASPYQNLILSGSKEKIELGKKALSKGEGAALLIAGGQGSRLGHVGPKGTYPITPVYGKSLFQIFCERVKKKSEELAHDLLLIIMTSPLNDSLTRRYLKEHSYFGLKESQVMFFTQGMLPFLNLEGNLFLNERNQIAKGPDGNGHCFHELAKQGLLGKLDNLGIKYINVTLVDNPLADPYDYELFGELISEKSELALKTCPRLSKEEKVGVIVEIDGKPQVIEYHELCDSLHFDEEPAANLGLFALSMDFLKRIPKMDLPLHKVKRKVPYFDHEVQKLQHPTEPNAWKFEHYIFDLFPFSGKTSVLSYDRAKVFCPLKNKEGSFSPKAVKASLLNIGIE